MNPSMPNLTTLPRAQMFSLAPSLTRRPPVGAADGFMLLQRMGYGQDLPILKMTAGQHQANRQTCRYSARHAQRGMTGHIKTGGITEHAPSIQHTIDDPSLGKIALCLHGRGG